MEDKSKEGSYSSTTSDKLVYMNDDGEIIVDPDHPEIKSAVDKELEDVLKQSISLPPIEYIKVLEFELEKLRKERMKLDPTAPKYF